MNKLPRLYSYLETYTVGLQQFRFAVILFVITTVLFCGLFETVSAAPIVPGSFSTTWQTDNPGSSNADQVSFSLGTGGDGESCSGDIYWEEVGNSSNNGSSTVDSNCNTETITFPSPGTYRIDILGAHPSFQIDDDPEKLLSVEQWGDNVWQEVEGMFYSATNLVSVGSDAPDLSQVTSIAGMFAEAINFNSDINHWDVSNVTSMNAVFDDATSFNQPLNNWDVSNVTTFGCYGECATGMFAGAEAFNQDISSWDVSSAQYMEAMFSGATSFNQDISSWDVSNVESFINMFFGAESFNQPLNTWDTSSVRDLDRMFSDASSFNQPLGNWNLSSAENISQMFSDASVFNQPLDTWDVTNITAMFGVFNNSGLSVQNYSDILNAWSTQLVNSSVQFGAANISYFDTASSARQILIDTYNWDIVDGGLYVEPSSDTFITRWDTRLSGPTNQIRIGNYGGGATNFIIDWGDGTEQYFTNDSGGDFIHTYATPGIKTITITGTFPYFSPGCDESNDYNKLIDVAQWGTTQWEYLYFSGCTYLTGFSATDVPNLTSMTDTSYMFYGATSFNGDVNDWDVSTITDMSYMFNGATAFNQRLDTWNISNVASMYDMLIGTAFTEAKYTKLLNSWSQLSVQPDVYFATDAQYCGATAQAARDILTSAPNNWVITDGGATADCVIEDVEENSDGSSGTRIGQRIKSFFYSSTTTSTPMAVTKESFIQGVRNLIDYLTKNEATLDTLTPEQSTKIIVGLREIIVFLLKLLPGF